MNLYATFLSVFLLSVCSVYLIRSLSYRFGWVARPRSDRWSERVVALYGGVGIFLSFIAASVLFGELKSAIEGNGPLRFFYIGCILTFFLGLADDLLELRPATKIIWQTVTICLPISAGLLLQWTPWYLVNVLLTFFWFIGIINAINIIDNMDGLSSGVVIISAASLGAILFSLPVGASYSSALLIAVILAASVLGFWVFNRYPASIFMGDSGSLFLGFVLASLTIPSPLNGHLGTTSSMFAFILPVAILAFPIFDTTLVTVLRKYHGLPASRGGRDHSSHRLVGLGFSENKAVWILYAFSAVGGIIAFLSFQHPAYTLPLFIGFVLLMCFVGVFLGRQKIYEKPADPEALSNWTPIVSYLFYKKQAAAVLLDIIIIGICYYGAYLLRFEGQIAPHSQNYVQSLPFVITACLVGFYYAGLYRGIWRFVSLVDIRQHIVGVATGVAASILIILILFRFEGYSRSLFFIFAGLLFSALVGSRLFFRLADEISNREGLRKATQSVLIYGAGQGGKLLAEEIIRNAAMSDYKIVGFIDDDPRKWNRSLNGYVIRSASEWMSIPDITVHEIWVSSAQIHDEKITDIKRELDDGIIIKRFCIKLELVDS